MPKKNEFTPHDYYTANDCIGLVVPLDCCCTRSAYNVEHILLFSYMSYAKRSLRFLSYIYAWFSTERVNLRCVSSPEAC